MNLDSNEIIPSRLWLGGFIRPKDVELLKRALITTVLSLQTDEDMIHCGIEPGKLAKSYEEADIELRRLPVRDFDKDGLADRLPSCVSELEDVLQAGWTRVYLHCTAGINRSPTVAAAYLIRTQGISAREACDFIVSKRHCSPYLEVLENYRESLRHA